MSIAPRTEAPPLDVPPPAKPRWWARWLRMLPLVLLALVLYREKPWTRSWPQISLLALAAMLALNFGLTMPAKVWRWRVALPEPPRFFSIYASLLEGFLANAALGFGAGDVVRSARLRGTRTFVVDYGAGVAERGAEFLAVAILLLLGGVMSGLGWPAIAAAFGCLAIYAVVLVFGQRLLPRLGRWPRLAAALAAGVAASTPGKVVAMTALSLASWVAELFILMIALAAFGLPGTAEMALLVLIGINVAIAVPGPPANFGTFEAGVVAALGLRGIPLDRALLFGLGYHLLLTIPTALAGAIVFLARGRRG